MSPRSEGAAPAALGLVVSALVAAAALRGAQASRRVAGPWERQNHAGRSVTLLEGPAWVAGAAVGGLAAGTGDGATGARLVAAVGAGALGVLDDLAGTTASKGLKGHLGALRRGEVTTGVVKILGLGVTGLAAAALADRGRGRGAASTLLGGAVVAGAANVVNLFDLRPGRALKVTLLAGSAVAALPGAGGATARTTVAVASGASTGVLADDLAARSMLGDTGANAAGALVGLALVQRSGLRGRAAALAALAALTLASERVSFSAVIDRHEILRRIDRWGRSAT